MDADLFIDTWMEDKVLDQLEGYYHIPYKQFLWAVENFIDSSEKFMGKLVN